jgi:hypothetical protein
VVLAARGMVAPAGQRGGEGFDSPEDVTVASDGQASYTAAGGDSA